MTQHKEKPSILVIRDDISEPERLESAASKCDIDYCSLAESNGRRANYSAVMFHAAKSEKDSLVRLEVIKQHFPSTPVAFLARRDQAPQIGFLLENGADKCFVKQLSPNEINRVMYAMQEQGVEALSRIQPWA